MATVKDRYLNPFTDFGFKKLFGEESQKDLLIDFLNALLPEKHHIRDLQYITRETANDANIPHNLRLINTICTSENGETFIVMLQKQSQNYYTDTSPLPFIASALGQTKSGLVNDLLAKNKHLTLYCVNLLDFVVNTDAENGDYVHYVQFKDEQNRAASSMMDVQYVFLEIPNFTKQEAELFTNADKWCFILKNAPSLQTIPPIFQEDKLFAAVFTVLDFERFTYKEMNDFQLSLKIYRDLKNTMDYAIEQATARGLAKAMKQNRKQGILRIAENMKESGMPLKEITQLTGLSESDLATL